MKIIVVTGAHPNETSAAELGKQSIAGLKEKGHEAIHKQYDGPKQSYKEYTAY